MATPGEVAQWLLGTPTSAFWTQIVPSLNGQDISALRNDPRMTALHGEFTKAMTSRKSRFDDPGNAQVPYNVFMDGVAQAAGMHNSKQMIKTEGMKLLATLKIKGKEKSITDLTTFLTNEHLFHDPIQRVLHRGGILSWNEAHRVLAGLYDHIGATAESVGDYDEYLHYRQAHQIAEVLLGCCVKVLDETKKLK